MTVIPRDPSPSAGVLRTTLATGGRILTVFRRTPQLVGATLGQGILFLLVFRYVFGGAIDTGDLSYIDFMTPGILVATILFAATSSAVGVAQERSDGFTERMLSLPASRPGLVLGRIVADATIVVGATLVTAGVAVTIGFRPQGNVAHLVAAGGLLALYALAFAAAFVALGSLADGPQTAQSFGFLAIPLTFVSSAYVPTETMPTWLAAVADNQPITHMVNAVRDLTYPVGGAATTTPLLIAVASASILVLAGAAATAVRHARR